MANRNSKHKNKILRDRAIAGVRQGQSFTHAFHEAIEAGRSICPVSMYFSDKWESNRSFRLFGI